MGFENVLSVEGLTNFKAENLQILKDNRVKTVDILFDNSMESELFKDVLLLENFKVKIGSVPSVSSVVPNTINKDDLTKHIETLEVFENADKAMFRADKDGSIYSFLINGMVYRVSGLKEGFTSNLKVNIKAEYNGEKFPDNVELFSSRSRNSFSTVLSQKFGVEPKKIEKDLIRILEYFEEERDKKQAGNDEKEIVLTDQEKEIGLEFLQNTNIFDEIVNDLEILGYIGEDLNKLLIYLCASSRILNDPISVLILSQSASGKSMLVDTVKKLIPPESLLSITSLSDQALNYLEDLMHKFLVFGEAVHNETIEHQIREMLSSKELSRLVTVKDEKTGKMASKTVRKDVIAASVMSSTNHKLNPENLSRFFVINADESKEQTKKIHEAQRKKYTLERFAEKKDRIPEIIKKHHSAQRMLRKLTIVNNFSEYLKFPDNLMRTRRDHDRFIDLIAVVCFIRQYQKEVQFSGEIEYIECDLADYEVAYEIMIKCILPATFSEIPKSAVELYESLRILAREIAKRESLNVDEVSFTQREIREATGFGQSWIKQNLRIIVDFEYIKLLRGKNRGERFVYQLKEDKDIQNINLSMIPTPEQMDKILQENGLVCL